MLSVEASEPAEVPTVWPPQAVEAAAARRIPARNRTAATAPPPFVFTGLSPTGLAVS